MKQAILFFADGMEECEALITADLLKRAGIAVTTASVMQRRNVRSSHGIEILSDILAEDAPYAAADILILPGGIPGVEHIRANDAACRAISDFAAQGRYVAAICAAPGVLCALGLLHGKQITVYPSCADRCPGAVVIDRRVVIDGNIITGQAVGSAFDFALAVIRTLLGDEAAQRVKQEIYL